MNQDKAQSIANVYSGEVKEDPNNSGKYLVFIKTPTGGISVFSDVAVIEYDDMTAFENSDNNSIVWLA